MPIVKTKKGDLAYRLPDISEGYAYLALIDSMEGSGDIFRTRGKIIKLMGQGDEPLLDFKALGYENYQQVLDDKEVMREPLTIIAKEIFEDVMDLVRKKD